MWLNIPTIQALPFLSRNEEGQARIYHRMCISLSLTRTADDLLARRVFLRLARRDSPAGMIKRIRGVAFSAKVSPQSSNRLVDGARGVLNAFLADVYIFTDHVSGAESGLSPGYGLTLVAETTAKNLISAEVVTDVTDKARTTPSHSRGWQQLLF